jgi:3-oxoacyl-[acyl-carrier-protein] synthase II
MQEVVVTGYGVISPIGNSIGEFERRMFAGESGIRNVRGSLVAENFPVPFAGVVDDSKLPGPEEIGLPRHALLSKNLQFGILSTKEALSYLSANEKIDGIVYGTAAGVFFEMVMDTFAEYDPEKFWWKRTCSEFGAEMIAEFAKSQGHGEIPSRRIISVNSACASGNHAIGIAYQMIQSGKWKRALAGGVDSGGWGSNLMNFNMLNALTTADVPAEKASRPFSADRSGFVKAEAAATLVLESREEAERRGAKILAKVEGFALTSDAFRLTDGRDDGLCVTRAMTDAVKDAGLSLDDIDYINAHGTSTPLNDRVETMAIKQAFGERAYKIPVSSLKSQTGHSTVAAGAIEAVACVLMLQRQRLAPTINLDSPDPECDLDYVPNKARDAKVNHILSNNLGFGGQNAMLVFGRAP